MSLLKSLLKDTALYGLPSIVGRFLNYLLVILHTAVMPATSGEYGVVTNLYAYTALILVFLTFGMETTFFRFANKEGYKADSVFSNALLTVAVLSVVVLLASILFSEPLAAKMGYPGFGKVYNLILLADDKVSRFLLNNAHNGIHLGQVFHILTAL